MRDAFRRRMQREVNESMRKLQERMDSLEDEDIIQSQKLVKAGNLYDFYYGYFMGMMQGIWEERFVNIHGRLPDEDESDEIFSTIHRKKETIKKKIGKRLRMLDHSQADNDKQELASA
jgi:hypothetical protein